MPIFGKTPKTTKDTWLLLGWVIAVFILLKMTKLPQMTLDDGQIKEEYQDEQRARELQAELSNYTGPRNSKNPSEKEKLLENFLKRNIIFSL